MHNFHLAKTTFTFKIGHSVSYLATALSKNTEVHYPF